MRSLADSARWSPVLHTVVPHAGAVGAPQSYARLLRGAGLRPLLAELSPHDAQEFSSQLATLLRDAYPPGPYGTVFPVPGSSPSATNCNRRRRFE
jgi:trans-aconitate 2-methyltransferase